MANLQSTQLKDGFQTLVSIGTTTVGNHPSDPLLGALTNGKGNALTQITLGLGSVGAPSYSFTGDTNTGLFASGADAIGLVTGGTSRLAIDSSGNVEIGANVGIGGTATKKLDIHHADTDGLRFTTADGAETFIDFGDASDNDIGGIIYDHNDNHMRLRTNNAERIRMFSDGDISFMSVSQNRDFYWEAGTSRLGLGTDSPSGLLHVKGDSNSNGGELFLQVNNNNTTDNIGAINFGNNADTTLSKILSGTSGNNTSSYLTFSTSATGTQSEAMRIDKDGNVGIGTTSNTTFALEVVGNATDGILAVKNGTNDANTFRSSNSGGTRTFDIGNNSSGHGIVNIRNSSGTVNTQLLGSGTSYFNGGSVAIGATSASQKLEVHDASSTTTANDGGVGIVIKNTNGTDNNQASLAFQNSNGTKSASITCTFEDQSSNQGVLSFGTGPGGGAFAEHMRIDSSGNVGIGTNNPSSILHLEDASSPKLIIKDTTNNCQYITYAQNSNAHLGTSSNHDLFIDTNNTKRIEVHNNGNISFFEDTGSTETLGWSASNERLSLSGSDYQFELKQGSNQPFFLRAVSDGSFRIHLNGTGDIFSVSSAGASSFAGSLTKGSGSFKIDHPLESKKDTHHLVHSFVESPQANNIYRGSVALSDGQATVNLDEVSTMTEGTFVALNTSIHVYTSNESDWDAVKGSVSGNILTIECQNAESNAMVNWLVIGERQDQHMIDTEWTDEYGKVIVEPLK
jgi:hypothetical protein